MAKACTFCERPDKDLDFLLTAKHGRASMCDDCIAATMEVMPLGLLLSLNNHLARTMAAHPDAVRETESPPKDTPKALA